MSEALSVHQVASLFRDGSRQHYEVASLKRAIEVLETVHRVRQLTSLLRMLSDGDHAHTKAL